MRWESEIESSSDLVSSRFYRFFPNRNFPFRTLNVPFIFLVARPVICPSAARDLYCKLQRLGFERDVTYAVVKIDISKSHQSVKVQVAADWDVGVRRIYMGVGFPSLYLRSCREDDI